MTTLVMLSPVIIISVGFYVLALDGWMESCSSIRAYSMAVGLVFYAGLLLATLGDSRPLAAWTLAILALVESCVLQIRRYLLEYEVLEKNHLEQDK